MNGNFYWLNAVAEQETKLDASVNGFRANLYQDIIHSVNDYRNLNPRRTEPKITNAFCFSQGIDIVKRSDIAPALEIAYSKAARTSSATKLYLSFLFVSHYTGQRGDITGMARIKVQGSSDQHAYANANRVGENTVHIDTDERVYVTPFMMNVSTNTDRITRKVLDTVDHMLEVIQPVSITSDWSFLGIHQMVIRLSHVCGASDEPSTARPPVPRVLDNLTFDFEPVTAHDDPPLRRSGRQQGLTPSQVNELTINLSEALENGQTLEEVLLDTPILGDILPRGGFRDAGLRPAPLRRVRRSERIREQQERIPRRSSRVSRPPNLFVPSSSNGRIRPGRGFTAGVHSKNFKAEFPLSQIDRLMGILQISNKSNTQVCFFEAIALFFSRKEFISRKYIAPVEGVAHKRLNIPRVASKTDIIRLFSRFYPDDCETLQVTKLAIKKYQGFDLFEELADFSFMIQCPIYIHEFLEEDLELGEFSGRLELLFHTRDFMPPEYDDIDINMTDVEINALFDRYKENGNASKDSILRNFVNPSEKRQCLKDFNTDCALKKIDHNRTIHLLYHDDHISLITKPEVLCDSLWCFKCSHVVNDSHEGRPGCIRKLMSHMNSKLGCSNEVTRKFHIKPEVYTKKGSMVRRLLGLTKLEGKKAIEVGHDTDLRFLFKGFACLDFEAILHRTSDFNEQMTADGSEKKKTQVYTTHDPCLATIAHNLNPDGLTETIDILNKKTDEHGSNQSFIVEVMKVLTKLAKMNFEKNMAEPHFQDILNDPEVSDEDKLMLTKKMNMLPVMTVNGGNYDMKLIADDILRFSVNLAELFDKVHQSDNIRLVNKFRMNTAKKNKRKSMIDEKLNDRMVIEEEITKDEADENVIILNRAERKSKLDKVFKPVMKGNSYIEMKFPSLGFTIRDITLIFKGSLDTILRTFASEGEQKGFFPYEKCDSYAFLRKVWGEPGCDFPVPIEDFWSELKQRNVLHSVPRVKNTDEEQKVEDDKDIEEMHDNYKNVKKVWKDSGMTTMEEYCVWYGRRDVDPLIAAIDKMRRLFAKDGMDILHDVLTMPSLGEKCMAYSIQEFADLDSIPEYVKWRDIFDKDLIEPEFEYTDEFREAYPRINQRFGRLFDWSTQINTKMIEAKNPLTGEYKKIKKGKQGIDLTNKNIREVINPDMKIMMSLNMGAEAEVVAKIIKENRPICQEDIVHRYKKQQNRCDVCLSAFVLERERVDDNEQTFHRNICSALIRPIQPHKGLTYGNITMTCQDCCFSIQKGYLNEINEIKAARRMYAWAADKIIMMVPSAEIFDMLKGPGGPTFVMHRHMNLEGVDENGDDIDYSTEWGKAIGCSDNGDRFRAFQGYDANALYPYALQQDQPCGLLDLTILDSYYHNPGPTLDELVRQIVNDEIYGMVEVDIFLPKRLWKEFPYLQPLFVTTKIPETEEIIGPYTFKQINARKVKADGDIKTLCCVYRARKTVLSTTMIKDLIGYGLKLRAAYRFIKATPAKCVRQFIRTTSNQRRYGDLAKKNKALADCAKLEANGCFGKTLEDKTRYDTDSYEVDKLTIKKLISNKGFIRAEVIKTDDAQNEIYLIKSRPAKANMDMPIQLGFTVFMESKRLMLSFVYNFIQPCLGLGNYKLLYMDTDCEVIAYTGESLEASVLPEMREYYEKSKRNFLVPNIRDSTVDVIKYYKKYLREDMDMIMDIEGNDEEIEFNDDLTTQSMFEYFGHTGKFSIYRETMKIMTEEEIMRADVSEKLGTSFSIYMSREPGLFKLEYEGTKGSFLSAKSYHMRNNGPSNSVILGHKIGSMLMYDDNDKLSPEVFKRSLLDPECKYVIEYQQVTKGGSKGINKDANIKNLTSDAHYHAIKGTIKKGMNNRIGMSNHEMQTTTMEKKLFNVTYKKKWVKEDGITCGYMLLDPNDGLYWGPNE